MTTPTVQINYATSATLTNAVTSLATSSTFVAGYESDVIDNTSNKYSTIKVGGKYTVGTTPTANTQIQIWVIPAQEDGGGTYVWPDVFDGTTSAETVTSAGLLAGFGYLAKTLIVDTNTSDRAYPFDFDIRSVVGYMPAKCVLFTTHNTGANFNATGGNHVTKLTGIYDTIPSI